jgi:hypothetical protein
MRGVGDTTSSSSPHEKVTELLLLRPAKAQTCVTAMVQELAELSVTIVWYDSMCCDYDDRRWSHR